MVNDFDVVVMIVVLVVLIILGVLFMGLIVGVCVGFVDGEYVLNLEVDDMQNLCVDFEQCLDLVVVGIKDVVMMVELEVYELIEEEMFGVVIFVYEQIQLVIDLIIDLVEELVKELFDFQVFDYLDLFEVVKVVGEE